MIPRTAKNGLAFLKKSKRDDVVTVGPTAAGPHFDSNGITMSISMNISISNLTLTHIHNHSHTHTLTNIRGRPRPRDPRQKRGYCEALHHR